MKRKKGLPGGYGSVYKMSGNRFKPWRAIVTVGFDLIETASGECKTKQKRKTIGYYETKQDALNALAEYNQNPYELDYEKKTVAEIYKLWSAEHFPTVSESNAKGYRASYLLCKPIENERLIDVKLDTWQKIVDNSGKNTPTLRKFKILVGQLYKYAEIHDYIPAGMNKTQYINIRKAGNPNAYNRTPFSKKEVEKLWKNKDSNVYYSVVLILIYTGCRISELLDLKKDDINLEQKWLDIIEAKTTAGIRKVPIADKIYPFFEYWYNLNECDYLLSTPNGEKFDYRNYYDSYWKPLMDYLELSHRPHDTRHTCISMLAEAGVDERIIKKIVGHKGQGVTQQVYTHFEIDILLEAINKM